MGEKYMVLSAQPVGDKQVASVFEDGVLVDSIVKENDVDPDDFILTVAKKWGVEDVFILGPSSYTKRIAERAQEKEIMKYGKSNLNIGIAGE